MHDHGLWLPLYKILLMLLNVFTRNENKGNKP